MDLGKVFSSLSPGNKNKSSPEESFLAVKISSVSVQATTWSVENDKVEIGPIASANLEGLEFEHLLKAVDKATSLAAPGENDKLAKVIFAVPDNWVEEGKIVPDQLRHLRHLCKELDFLPLGYVVLTEALENFYKEVEGAPLTAILVGIDPVQSTLTLYRAGKILGAVPLGLDTFTPESIVAAIESALKRFAHLDVLPARIIIYDGISDLEKIAQKITAHPWTGRLPFLHFPKVEKVPNEFVVKAVAAAGGMQMGASLAQAAPEFPQPAEELQEVPAQEAGFIADSDFSSVNIPVPQPSPLPTVTTTTTTLPSVSKYLAIVKSMVSKLSLPKLSVRKSLLPLLLVPLFFLLVAAAAVSYLLPKATVDVLVASRKFDHQLDWTLQNPTTVTVSELGTLRGPATGSKLVGDRAKGSVTIHGVSSGRTFVSGTKLTSPDGLKFTLDRDVPIASGDAITPATATVSITAADIGSNSNVAGGTKFTLASVSPSEYLAKNDAALSGGSSHQATVVTKSDQDKLLATLSAQLTDKARGDLESKVGSSGTLLPSAITSEVAKKKFSKDVDTETDSLTLDLTLNFQGVVFSKDDVVQRFAQEFSSDIPTGYTLSPQNSTVDVKSSKTDKKGTTTLTVSLFSTLVPQLSPAEIQKNIVGKKLQTATTYISSLPGVSGVQVTVSPKVFGPLMKFALPWKKDNIKVEVLTN